MFLAFCWISVWVASTCSTSDVPMPCASAPNAPWVEVWLSPHTMVVPGRVKPCSGPMIWTMPWRRSRSLKYSMPNSRALSASVAIWSADSGSSMPLERSVVGTLWSTTASVFSGARTRAAGHAQALEGLRAGHLVHQMPVDIEQAGAVGRLMHQMGVPDLVVDGAGLGHGRGLSYAEMLKFLHVR